MGNNTVLSSIPKPNQNGRKISFGFFILSLIWRIGRSPSTCPSGGSKNAIILIFHILTWTPFTRRRLSILCLERVLSVESVNLWLNWDKALTLSTLCPQLCLASWILTQSYPTNPNWKFQLHSINWRSPQIGDVGSGAEKVGDRRRRSLRKNLPPHRLQQVQNAILIMMIILLGRDEFPKEYVPTVFENYVTDIEVLLILYWSSSDGWLWRCLLHHDNDDHIEGGWSRWRWQWWWWQWQWQWRWQWWRWRWRWQVDGTKVELEMWDTAGQEDYDRNQTFRHHHHSHNSHHRHFHKKSCSLSTMTTGWGHCPTPTPMWFSFVSRSTPPTLLRTSRTDGHQSWNTFVQRSSYHLIILSLASDKLKCEGPDSACGEQAGLAK